MFKLLKIKNNKILFTLILLAAVVILYIGYFVYSYKISPSIFNSKSSYLSVNLSGLNTFQAQEALENSLKNIKIVIQVKDYTYATMAYDFGITIDHEALMQAMNKQKLRDSLIPFSNYSLTGNFTVVDEWTIKNEIQNNLQNPDAPVNARYAVSNGKIIITNQSPGKSADTNQIINTIKQKLNTSQEILVETTIINSEPVISTDLLKTKVTEINNIYKNSYVINYAKTKYEINKNQLINDISVKYQNNLVDCNLYLPSSSAKKLVESATQKANISPVSQITTTYKSGKPNKITQEGEVGAIVSNTDELSSNLIKSIQNKTPYLDNADIKEVAYQAKTITLDDTNIRSNYKYKVSSWGNIKSDINEFSKKVSQTLDDGRGWAQANVSFEQVDNNETLEIVLSEPSQLPARFPNTCDAYYSCRVGKYVIINEDRWLNATPVWTGTIRDYQHLVVNHEAGHWLGLDHPSCPANGQPAPVMMQQSINLGGCTFNPWPLESEISSLL